MLRVWGLRFGVILAIRDTGDFILVLVYSY